MANVTANESRKHPVTYARSRLKNSKLGLLSLSALVVGGIVGSGIFNLMKEMAIDSSPVAVIIAWVIAGIGMGALAYSFYNLSRKRPELEAGVYSYAEASFGKFIGFNSAWGYWISAWVGNVAYATMTFSALGYFFHVFGDGTNIWSVIGASVGLWLVAALVLSGIKNASFMNILVTIAKFIPLVVFLVAIIFAFRFHMFSAEFWGNLKASGSLQWGDLLTQVRGTMFAAVFAFIGIEGAVVLSGRAEQAKNVGKATALGFLTVIALYILITVLSFGVMSQHGLANLSEPAMGSLLESVVGKWGGTLVSIGVIISVLGAWLAWTLFSLELPYRAAKKGVFPAVFAKESRRGVPWVSLLITTVLVQIFVFSFLVSDRPYNLMFSLCSSMILLPYLFSALFQLKNSWQEKRGGKGRGWNIAVGAVATIYAVWLLYAGGVDYLLTMIILYAIGVPIYIWARKNSGTKRIFKLWEMIVAILLILVAIYGVYWMTFQGGYTALMG